MVMIVWVAYKTGISSGNFKILFGVLVVFPATLYHFSCPLERKVAQKFAQSWHGDGVGVYTQVFKILVSIMVIN